MGQFPRWGSAASCPPKVFVVGGEDEDVMTTAFPMVAADEYCGAWDDGVRYEEPQDDYPGPTLPKGKLKGAS